MTPLPTTDQEVSDEIIGLATMLMHTLQPTNVGLALYAVSLLQATYVVEISRRTQVPASTLVGVLQDQLQRFVHFVEEIDHPAGEGGRPC